MNFPKMQLTQAGIDAVLEAVYNSGTITFTTVRFGDGDAPADVKAATGLTHVVTSPGISSHSVADHLATIRVIFNNSSISSGFYFREIGVFAKLNDGADFLYAYTNAGADAGFVKPYSAENLVTMSLDIVVAVGDAENIEAIISGAVGYVTINDFEDHVNNYSNPHRVTKEQIGLGNVPNLAPSDMTVSFTRASTLQNLTSGWKLSQLFGALSRAVYSLIEHIRDHNNPHQVTASQIGAAPAASFTSHITNYSNPHRVTVDQLNNTSGTLAVDRGGTGQSTLEGAKNALNYKTTYYQATLLASGWTQDGGYTITGYDNCNLEISLANTATRPEQAWFSKAKLVGDAQGNILHALGKIPEADIPIIIKAEEATA